jgi:anti-sigma factor RsiW
MNCKAAIDVMGDALEEALPPTLRTAFEGHMAACPPCRNYLENLRLTRMALQQLPRQGATGPDRLRLVQLFRETMRSRGSDPEN